MKLALIAVLAVLAGCAPLTPEQWERQNRMVQAMQASQAQQRPAQYNYMLPTQQYAPSSPAQYQPAQQASGVVAAWTGSQKFVQTVTGRPGVECQYQYAGQYFTRVFATSCPSSVQVQ